MLKDQIAYWRSRDEVLDIHASVDPRFEVAAITAEIQSTSNKIAVFHNVQGYETPVALNLYGCRNRLRHIVGADASSANTLAVAINRHISACLSPGSDFTVQADSTHGMWESSALSTLPILTYHEEDAGAYITSGIIIAKDPETGVHNLSFHRAMVVSDQELRISIGPRHDLGVMQRRAEELGRAVEAVFLVGVSPELFIAACTSIPPDADELALAAAIKGRPIPMRRSTTLGLDIPFDSDIVIEGRILPTVRRTEAPFGEWMGNYIEEKQSHVFEVVRVEQRPEAMMHGLICGSNEDLRPLEMATSARIYKALSSQFSGIVDVTCHPNMLCTVVKLKPAYEGHARQVLLAAISAHFLYSKLCIVVDDDVDIYDLEDVFWAYVTRARPDQRTIVLGDLPGFYRDPHKDHWGRLALDATIPWGREHEFRRKKIPGRTAVDLKSLLAVASQTT